MVVFRRALARSIRRYCSAGETDWGEEGSLRKYRSGGEGNIRKRPQRAGTWTEVPDGSKMSYENAIKALEQDAAPSAFDAIFMSQGCPHPLEVFEDMNSRRAGYKMRDHVICRFLLQCRKLISKDKREIAKAKSLFYAALNKRHMVGPMSNNALIMCFCEAGKVEGAETTFRKMKKMDFHPSLHAYCAMIKVLCIQQSPDLPKAWEYFQQMITMSKHDPDEREKVKTSVCMAGTSLLIGARNVKSADYAEKVWDLLVRQWKMNPSAIMYSHYIAALCTVDMKDQALEILAEMKHSGTHMTSHPYFYILKSLNADAMSVEQAEQLLEEMHELDIPTSVHIWTVMIRLYQLIDDKYGVISSYGRMRRCNIIPSIHTWVIMLNACVSNCKHPDDVYGRLIPRIWHKMRFGIRRDLRKKGAVENHSEPEIPVGTIARFVKVFEENQNEEGLHNIVEHLRSRNVLCNDSFTKPIREALCRITTVESKKLLDSFNSEILAAKASLAKKRAVNKETNRTTLKNSTRPIHAAARQKLQDKPGGHF